MVAVGGTSLLFSSSGTFSAENAWSSGGGGCGTVEAAPSTQSSFSQYAQVGCNGRRSTPDVALDADPASGVAVYDSTPYSGSSGWWTVGGTSASTPMWAAESAVLGSAVNAATVYSAAIPFRDIISGSNGHSTLTGYDLATGRGSWAYTPGPSTSLSAALAGGNVALKWTAPTGAPPTSYSVYRSTTSGAETLLASGTVTPSFTTAPPASGSTYYYEVQAVNGAGTGPFSNESSISGTPPPPTTTTTSVPRSTTTTTTTSVPRSTTTTTTTSVPRSTTTTTTTSVPRSTTTTTTVAHPLTASFTKSCSRASCTFRSTSKDTGGTITKYAWSGGNGISGTASVISHAFTSGGTFSVQLTVTDSRKLSATVTNQVICTTSSGRLTCS